jgi:hypothetical protein
MNPRGAQALPRPARPGMPAPPAIPPVTSTCRRDNRGSSLPASAPSVIADPTVRSQDGGFPVIPGAPLALTGTIV